jgi:hypothetical protein
MKNTKWLVLLVGILACGLIAAGCGDDDEEPTSDAPAVEAEDTATDEAATEDSEATEETSDSSGEIDAEGVYTACTDAIEGTAAEEAGQAGCEQARDAFEQCASAAVGTQAEESAIKICQDAAEQAIKALESAQGY